MYTCFLPRHLTTLGASRVCYRDSFTFTSLQNRIFNWLWIISIGWISLTLSVNWCIQMWKENIHSDSSCFTDWASALAYSWSEVKIKPSALKMEAAGSWGMLVTICQTEQCYCPEDNCQNLHNHENISLVNALCSYSIVLVILCWMSFFLSYFSCHWSIVHNVWVCWSVVRLEKLVSSFHLSINILSVLESVLQNFCSFGGGGCIFTINCWKMNFLALPCLSFCI